MVKPRVVIVKFRQMRALSERQRSIRALVGKDLIEAEALFPDSDEPELATLYEVRLREDVNVKRVVENLLQDDEVEYAHVPAERGPVEQ